jgi:UPF0716 protein FxsA
MVRWIVFGLVALPIAELAVFLLVAGFIGLVAALMLMLLTSVLGVLLLKQAGRSGLAQLNDSVRTRNIGTGLETGSETGLGDVAATASAGLLLLVPGFLTDLLGVLILLPAFRQWIGPQLQRAATGGTSAPAVIDLEPGEWRQVAQPKLRRPGKRPKP